MTSPVPEIIIKMSSLLNVSNGSSKPEEFNLNDLAVVVDSEEQNWFKRARVGKFLGLKHIDTSVDGLDKCEMPARSDRKTAPHGPGFGPGLRIIKTRRINSSQSFG